MSEKLETWEIEPYNVAVGILGGLCYVVAPVYAAREDDAIACGSVLRVMLYQAFLGGVDESE